MTKEIGNASPRTRLYIHVRKEVVKKLEEIANIENTTRMHILERLIMNYIPVPVECIPGSFRIIGFRETKILRKIKPGVLIISVFTNNKIGIDINIWKLWQKDEMTTEEFRRRYIERLILPDAQEEIKRLKKFRETQDVYITSWETDEEKSMRKIFVEYINGNLTWT